MGAGAASCGRRPLTAALLLLLPPGGVTPDAPFSQPDPRSTHREGPQRVASTPHLPEALLTLFPPDPSASRLHPVVQLPCFLLGGLPGTPQPAAPPAPQQPVLQHRLEKPGPPRTAWVPGWEAGRCYWQSLSERNSGRFQRNMQSDLDEGGGRVGRGGPTCTAGRTYLQSGAGRRRCGPGALGAVGPVDFFIKDVLWKSSYVFVPESTPGRNPNTSLLSMTNLAGFTRFCF